MNTISPILRQRKNSTSDFGLRIADCGLICRVPKLLCALVVVLIVLGGGRVGEAKHVDSVPVFQCAFGEDWDVNYDGWPDRWVRITGEDYPHYVNVAIEDDSTAVGGKCLTMHLDGAAAAIASPSIGVMSRFSYACDAKLKTEELTYSTVVMTLEFCDAKGRVLQTAKTEPVGATSGWQTIRLNAVEPRDPAIDRVNVGLQVLDGSKGDLKGKVSLADVRLERLPRIDVSTNNRCNVYKELNAVEVRCALSGIPERDPEIHFQLLDGSNHELQSEHFRLNGRLIEDKANRAAGAGSSGESPDGFEGTLKWKPKIPDYGFYRVVVRMMSSEAAADNNDAERQLDSRTVDLVVVPPLGVAMPRQGEFGWTLPEGDQPLSFQVLGGLLAEVGINWVKTPVWFDANDPRRGDELIRFVELLGASNIDVVGIIDRPPSKTANGNRATRDISITDVLSEDSSTWSAALEPVMSRLALRVRWWQLGRDYDTSLISLPTLKKRINELRTALFRFGQDVRMGLCADWESAGAYSGNVPWDFVQLGSPTQPTKKKFEELLARPHESSAQRWVVVHPPKLNSFQSPPSMADVAMCAPDGVFFGGVSWQIPAWIQTAYEAPQKQEAARVARASAFVHRLLSAKLNGANAIIIPKPFDDENGLMRADGMPAELLLPWRTTAAMLGGAEYLGEMHLPSGSRNRVFLRPDKQIVMVAWNRRPTREVLYLGTNVRQLDILGRSTPAVGQGREQVIEVGPAPTFVLGLHEAITRWRMTAHFETTQVPSVSTKPHHNSFSFTNFFPQGVGGTVKIVVLQDQATSGAGNRPGVNAAGLKFDRWTIEPPQATFQLATNAETKFPFDVKLKNALYGKQPVRVDFTVEADERLQFSVYSDMEVGTDEFELDVRSHVDKDGTLVIEQLMTNRTDRLTDFKCHLRARKLQPQRMQVYRLSRQQDRKVYRIPNGRELVGQEMLLEIEEVNGPRVLNYRFVANDQPKSIEESDEEEAADSELEGRELPSATDKPLATLGS